jgi:gliding motility-associated protein GldM
MINLMYLVLTALLALNVSAEVMNAFFTLDDGNKASIATVESQLEQTVKGVKDLLSDPSKRKYKPIEPAIDEVRAVTKDFNTYVDELRDILIDEAGDKNGENDEGDYIMDHGHEVPKGKKNKDVTTRLLVDEGMGEELKAKILETRERMVTVYTELLNTYGDTIGLSESDIQGRIQNIANNLPFGIDDETWKESKDKKSWADYKFRQMPLAAVLPLMSQMQSDAKSSEAALINSMAELTGGRVIEFDAFFPVVQAKKAYVIKGEPFEATISVGTYSTQIDPEDIGLYVNGTKLSVNEEGKAEYKASTSSTGKQTLRLRAEVRNPLTGEISDGEDTYEYEVGVRSATVSADKMNVFYIGVDNPISVSVAGASSNDVSVSGQGVTVKAVNKASGKYMVTGSKPTDDARIIVSGGGLPSTPFQFRVKRIPDPVARLGNKEDGSMGNGTFKAQGGLIAWLDNFDFDARCDIQGFKLVRVPKRQDPIEVINKGGTFSSDAKRIANMARPGDTYYFFDVKARCPGDVAGRKINSLVFTIK